MTPLPNPAERPTITVAETAAILGIGRNQAYDAIARGELPSLKLGRRVLVPVAPLRKVLGLDDPTTAGPEEQPITAA